MTWRDVKHILASTARKIDSSVAGVSLTIGEETKEVLLPWTDNAAGYSFHDWYGFGAVHVDDAVEFAQSYGANSLGEFHESAWFELNTPSSITDNDLTGVRQTLNVLGPFADANIEAVVVEIDWEHEFQTT